LVTFLNVVTIAGAAVGALVLVVFFFGPRE